MSDVDPGERRKVERGVEEGWKMKVFGGLVT